MPKGDDVKPKRGDPVQSVQSESTTNDDLVYSECMAAGGEDCEIFRTPLMGGFGGDISLDYPDFKDAETVYIEEFHDLPCEKDIDGINCSDLIEQQGEKYYDLVYDDEYGQRT